MKETEYRQWLEIRDYQEKTIAVQIYRVKRVEEFHRDLDEHYARDRMASVIEELKYSRKTGELKSGRATRSTGRWACRSPRAPPPPVLAVDPEIVTFA